MEKLRSQIEKIDQKIVELLNRRAKVSQRIGELKKKKSLPIFDPARESKLLSKIKSFSKGPLNPDSLSAIYREIISACLSLQKPLSIAYLGPEASFTHQAAIKRFGKSANYIPCRNISDIFSVVEKKLADYGVVPVENSIEGAVTYTLDMLIDTDLKICSQIMLEISHNLLANCNKEQIRRIYSHPIVFGQCRMWLEENISGVELCEVPSTAYAAELARKEKFSAAIASLLAAQVYGLKVIAEAIEDVSHNITRFLVVGDRVANRTGKDRTSIVFSVKDEVGALHHMLLPFKRHKINLTKIESRPSKKKVWDYYFFVDLEGHIDDVPVKSALSELEKRSRFLKVLGSYPQN